MNTRLLFLLTFLITVCPPTFSQETAADPTSVAVEALSFEQRLDQLKKTLLDKENEKKLLEKELTQETDQVTINQIKQELTAAEDIILGLREEIVSLATGGGKLFDSPATIKQEFNWRQDLELIFEPLLVQLREISERPRQIDELEAKIEYWRLRVKELTKVMENIEANIESVTSKALKKDLSELLDTASSRHKSAEQKLSLLQNELIALKQSDNPIWITLGAIFTGIALAMIFHFFLAVLAGFVMYQLVKFLSFIPLSFIKRRKTSDSAFVERAVSLVRAVIGMVLAVMVYFVVLYSVAEWLLLLISFLIVAGLVLGLKDAIPRYLIEAKTLLNLGSIRQGERIVFNGLPWKINRLNVHTHLHNPALHGHLRVPLTEISSLSSRPFHQDEPWFPTRVGDVVMLADDTFGKVVRQTPEMVQIDFGGSIYTYVVNDFLIETPRNLSSGFTLHEIFGLDYQYQKNITTTILKAYHRALHLAFERSEFAKHLLFFDVEFEKASSSSLDFKVTASFDGEAAEHYFKIKRFIQKESVDIANREQWLIPFEQMTLHYQSG